MIELPRVVFDTNVLLSAVLSPKGTSYALVHLASEGKITGYTSKTLMAEFKKVVQRDYQVPLERTEQMVDVFLQFLRLVEPDFKLDVVKADEADNRVLECANYSNAEYLVSWDPHLTSLKHFKSTVIMNPGKLLAELKEVHGIE